jgi:hypothetical protein
LELFEGMRMALESFDTFGVRKYLHMEALMDKGLLLDVFWRTCSFTGPQDNLAGPDVQTVI